MNQTLAEEQQANEKTFKSIATKFVNNRIGVETFLNYLAIDGNALVHGSHSPTIKALMLTWEGTDREKRQGVVDLARNYLIECDKLPQAEEAAAAIKITASPSMEEQMVRLGTEMDKLKARIEQLEMTIGKKRRAKKPA